MPVARSARELFDYVLMEDRDLPAEQQTTFSLRALSTRVSLALDNLASTDGKDIAVRVGHRIIATVRAGLAGWRNFNDKDGKPIPFHAAAGPRMIYGVEVDNPADLESLEWFSPEQVKELAGAIVDGNQLTRADVRS